MGLPGWPDYWYGFPPMYYATHAVSPLADIIEKPISSVRCYGSGQIDKQYAEKYQSPFAVETVQIEFKNSDVKAEVTRSLFDTIRQYRESFDIYASEKSFEWEQVAGEGPVLYSGFENAERIKVPETDTMLPKEISRFALKNQIVNDQHVSFIQGSGHGGSHPHLVHEFISAINQNRLAHVSAQKAANWTEAGILAHKSAISGGEKITL
jgi:predicted dehydrogenase